MTSYLNTNNYDNMKSEFERNKEKSNELPKGAMQLIDSYAENHLNQKDRMTIQNVQKRKTSLEACNIHTKNIRSKSESRSDNDDDNVRIVNEQSELQAVTGKCRDETLLKTDSDSPHHISNLQVSCDMNRKVLDMQQTPENQTDNIKEISHASNKLITNEFYDATTAPINEFDTDTKTRISVSNNNSVQSSGIQDKIKVDNDIHSQSSLPDILNMSNRTADSKMRSYQGFCKTQAIDTEKEKNQMPKSIVCQTSYLSNLLSSEALQDEMEIELKQLQHLHSLEANQSIYKLAYDETITDQSEADSRSPSPLDPENQVPSSLTSAEILIHEADSGSEAGSEDVELLPHRYESETFLNENKHVYVNKLSLAVELLRTQESIPYDDEFKRVAGENFQANNIAPIHKRGKVNCAFVGDSCSPNQHVITNIPKSKNLVNANEVVRQCQLKQSASDSSNNAMYSDIGFENLEDGLCEPGAEVEAQCRDVQDNTEGVRAGYRRFGVQARHYFSHRAPLSLNPCFCCIIM